MTVSPLVASVITVPSSVPAPIPTIVPAIVVTVVTEPEAYSRGRAGVSRVAAISVVWVIGAVARAIYASP